MCPIAVFWEGKPVFDSGYGIKQSMSEHKVWSQPDPALSPALPLPSSGDSGGSGGEGGSHGGGTRSPTVRMRGMDALVFR